MKNRTSLTLADAGSFEAIKTQAADIKSLLVATLYGICTGVSERKSPDKVTVFHGQMGNFRIKPAGDGEALEAGYLYFPPEFNAIMAPWIAKMKEAGDGSELRFVFELSAVRAKNEAGYSFAFTSKIDPVLVNRIDDFVSRLTPAAPAKK